MSPGLADLFQKALESGGQGHTPEEIAAECAAGRMQLWPGQQSVAVTQIHDLPGRKVLHILYAAGDGRELAEMEKSAADWAKAQGCTSLMQNGRRGWCRVLKKRGWREVVTTMERGI